VSDPPAIEFRSVTKRFGKRTAVDGLSLSVAPGEICGLLGPNGAGKTTALRMLLGLVRPSAGATLVFGRPLRAFEQPARVVGAVMENAPLHPGRSARDHLSALAPLAGADRARVDEVLEFVGMADAARRKARTYSLGMRQRVALAAALLGRPRVLVLDEPANGLDPAGIRWLRDTVARLAHEEGCAVLLSSHVLAEVERAADSVAVVDRGRLVAAGPTRELVGARQRVRFAGPDAARLAEALAANGAPPHPDGAGSDGPAFVVEGVAAVEVGRAAAAIGAVLAELREERDSLEEVFLRLTGGDGDVAAATGADGGSGAPARADSDDRTTREQRRLSA